MENNSLKLYWAGPLETNWPTTVRTHMAQNGAAQPGSPWLGD